MFVVGPPGVCKTTLVRRLLGPLEGLELHPKPKWTVRPGELCAAGHYTGGTFDGADTVPYNGVEAALEYWGTILRDLPLTIFDGDRFSHPKALAVVLSTMQARVVHLTAPPEILAERRARRGSNQNAAWMAGRATKAKRFAQELGLMRLEVSAESSLEMLEGAVKEFAGMPGNPGFRTVDEDGRSAP